MTSDRSVAAGDRSVPIKQVHSNVCSLTTVEQTPARNASHETIAQQLGARWQVIIVRGAISYQEFLVYNNYFYNKKKSWHKFPISSCSLTLFVRQFLISSCLLTLIIIIVRDNCPTLAARWVLTLIIIVRDNCPAVLFDRWVLTITVIIFLTTVQL